jgi:acetoacetate decarboxylase
MGFVKTMDEITAKQRKTAQFYDAEVLTVFFETNPVNAARLLPPPLKPSALPIGAAFVARYPKVAATVDPIEFAPYAFMKIDDL